MLGLFSSPAVALAAVFSNGSSIGSGQVAYGDSGGKIKGISAFLFDGTRLSVGGTALTLFQGGTVTPLIQALANTGARGSMAAAQYTADAVGSILYLGKSRSTTVGTPGVITTGDTLGNISFQGDDGTSLVNSADILGVSTGAIGTGQIPGILRFRTASSAGTITSGFLLDSTQNLVVGNTTTASAATYSGAVITPRVQVKGANASAASIAIANFTNNTAAGSFYFAKSRAAGTIDTMTVVATGDTLGTMDFQGSDGTNFVSAAQIGVTCTGTIASTRVPGNLVISTGTDAAPTVMTAALTINNVQQVNHNSTVDSTTTATGGSIFGGGIGVAKGITSGGARFIKVTAIASAAGTTVLDGTYHSVVVTGATTQTLTLPACATGRVLYIKNRSSGNVTVNRAGSDTIDGGTTATLTSNQSATYIGNTTDWTLN